MSLTLFTSVHSAEEAASLEGSFQPEFVHQIFGEGFELFIIIVVVILLLRLKIIEDQFVTFFSDKISIMP